MSRVREWIFNILFWSAFLYCIVRSETYIINRYVFNQSIGNGALTSSTIIIGCWYFLYIGYRLRSDKRTQAKSIFKL